MNSHPKIMTSIANASSKIARETLKINSLNDMKYNDYSPGFLNLLKEIMLSFEMVKNTSNLPAIASDNLVDVGKTAIDLEYPRVTESIVQILGEINFVATKLHLYRGDDISNYINSRIAYLLNYSIENLDKLGIYRKDILEDMINEINKNIDIYLKDDYIHSDINIKPYTASLYDYNISVIAHNLIRKIQNKEYVINNYEKDFNYDGLNILKKILDGLNHNINVSIKEKHLPEIL